jgi:hypothetical protein
MGGLIVGDYGKREFGNEGVELMKGTCEIQSEPGQGTTVHVDISFVAAR